MTRPVSGLRRLEQGAEPALRGGRSRPQARAARRKAGGAVR